MKYPGGRVMIWAMKGNRVLATIVDNAIAYGIVCCQYRHIYPKLNVRQLEEMKHGNVA